MDQTSANLIAECQNPRRHLSSAGHIGLLLICFLVFSSKSALANEKSPVTKSTAVSLARLKIVDSENTGEKHLEKVYLDGRLLGSLNDDTGETKIGGNLPPAVLPDGTSDYQVTALNSGWLLLTGGHKPETKDKPLNVSDAVYFWKPEKKKLEKGQSLRYPRVSHQCTELPDGKILVTGGIAKTGQYLSQVEIIDPSARSVADGGKLLEGRLAPSILKLKDGRVLFAGGQVDFDNTAGMESQTAEIYNPKHKTSRQCCELLYHRQGDTLLHVSDKACLLLGGYNSQSEPNSRHLPAEMITLPK